MSAPLSLDRRARLTGSNAFQPLFKTGQRFKTACFAVYFLANGAEGARLGIAVSKRNVPRAVDRNRLKRTVRESFRVHRHLLGAVDVVVLVNAPALTAGPANVRTGLADIWERIRNVTHSPGATR